MRTPESRGRRSSVLWAMVLGLGVGLLGLAPAVEATRTMPGFVGAFEPGPAVALDLLTGPEKPNATFALFDDSDLSLFAALSLLNGSEIGCLSAENRFRLFTIPGEIPPQFKRAWLKKTASRAFSGAWECNIPAPLDLAHICGSLSFQTVLQIGDLCANRPGSWPTDATAPTPATVELMTRKTPTTANPKAVHCPATFPARIDQAATTATTVPKAITVPATRAWLQPDCTRRW